MGNEIYPKEIAAEFLGSMFLVMAAISPIILFTSVFAAPIAVAVLANAVSVAFVLCVLIEIFGPYSGAHFNPVVTLVMVLEKKINVQKAATYVVFQVAGGIAGIMASHLMFFDAVGGLLFVSETTRNGHVLFGEIFGTFILVLAILLLVKAKSTQLPVMVGLLVGGQLLATSSTMFANPQVTIARMLTSTTPGIRPTDGFVFIVMQFAGALLAYGIYRLVFSKMA
ncbi:MAG: aquaporin [Defluviitaleaceae bacterium]|nr:aquaporin [Defluviitaleaceae bacterium]